MKQAATLQVKGIAVGIKTVAGKDYISLTDIARNKNPGEPKDVIKNWMRSRETIEFLGLWEQLNNPDFKGVEIDPFLHEAGSNTFTLSPSRWITTTNAIGLISKAGNAGGTFAHKDIAFEFASWVSSAFKLYLIKEFQRLKEEEHNGQKPGWNFQRTLAKINYQIHADAIHDHLIPATLTREQIGRVYASEADLLNTALFGKTAREWLRENPDTGNLRDTASIEQLIVLSNLESINAMLIRQELPQAERLLQLNAIAITQLTSLIKNRISEKLALP